ncbi:MAG: glutamate synthase large subunit [Herpetosiphon sp.]
MNTWDSVGLYDPRWEHDACGIGFIAYRDGRATHAVVEMALTALRNLQHRGGVDADGKSGDGVGVLTQIPYALLADELQATGAPVPARDDLAVAQCFLPDNDTQRAQTLIDEQIAATGHAPAVWRVVPTNEDALGERARELKPATMQALLTRPMDVAAGAEWERRLYLLRRRIETAAQQQGLAIYLPSLSSRTIVYKGLFAASGLGQYYLDLQDERYCTALAVYHQRFSTNTMPTWERAQPFRMLSHNGEINTLAGNVAALHSRETEFESALWGDQIDMLKPAIADATASDSAKLDNTLELLVHSGRGISHGLSMLVPAAWEQHPDLSPEVAAFYRYHAGFMAPWDGPAALCFSDGVTAGIGLDRNGLRPVRYLVTDDGLVVCGSEAGAVPIDEARIDRKGRLGPGEMLVVDTQRHLILENDAVKRELGGIAPFQHWVEQYGRVFSPPDETTVSHETELGLWQRLFGYTAEDVQVVVKPMARDGHEPIGSMGDDTPSGALTQMGRPLASFLRQSFAQVTNPPIDPLREKLVMSVRMRLGRRRNLLGQTPEHAHLLEIEHPVLREAELATLKAQDEFPAMTVDATWPVAGGVPALRSEIERLQRDVLRAAAQGAILIVVSDRGFSAARAPMPSLIAVGATHQALLTAGVRARTNIIAESGEPRDVHQIACLIGNGAELVQPYVALATARHEWLHAEEARCKKAGLAAPDAAAAVEGERNYVAAVDEGLRKILSKMGISTLDSYNSAQLYEAIGIGQEIVDVCFKGIPTRVGGIGWNDLAEEALAAHHAVYQDPARAALPHHGDFKWKKDGEYHAHAPATVHALHAAVGIKPYVGELREAYRLYSQLVHKRAPFAPRDLLRFAERQSIPLAEVESVEAILQRFSTAAMSLGSTSHEAHSTLAIAMRRLGGMSNSGEGGEDPARYGDDRNSDIKQVASGRFGVTPAYLMSARELQIKMAQGSKPGEGGQLPGHKVTEEIARVRHTTPGVTLISPPPHHDIYSIEDLAQLICDLQQVNPAAAISVKLVATAGVGTIAAGVVKAGANVVQISGHSGGTGASPLSSIKYAGIPWELGLAETQQTLVLNRLRDRVRLRTDGGLQTGRDVVMAALLGADEYSFGTTAVVAEGCVMARSCHTNTCPVGIATQRPELRAKFPGTPDTVMHFFLHLAEEVREVLAQLGARSLDEVIGHTELLERVHFDDVRYDRLMIEPMLVRVNQDSPCRFMGEPGEHMPSSVNQYLLAEAEAAFAGEQVEIECAVNNTDLTIGATLAGAIAARFGDEGLQDDRVLMRFRGSAGQSFGAFATPGLRFDLAGEANDYVGKGMGGGTIIVRPVPEARFVAAESAIIGNTCLYGATGGALWAAGMAGERFAVRNSGALAVVEGIGDHGCEYMTGGTVMVLGAIGRNFGAGMTGGTAYLWDADGQAPACINGDLVIHQRLSEEYEIEEVRRLVEQHVQHTGSERAQQLLQDWPRSVQQFWRISGKGAPATLSIPLRTLEVAKELKVGSAR